MTRTAGVLCTRIRLEEKRLMDALGKLSVPVKPLPPSDAPLPIQPLSAMAVGGEGVGETISVVIDRLQDRSTAAVWLPYWRTPDREMIDAGVAATLDRLSIARLLAEAGLPRPETTLVISESSGLNAIELFEGRGTLLPLKAGSRELPLVDREIAEAVLEHRNVLGKSEDTIALMQQGIAAQGCRVSVIVVDGRAVAIQGECPDPDRTRTLAEETARLLGARMIGVTIAEIDERLVVWDVEAVPAFRDACPIDGQSVEGALAGLVERLMIQASVGHGFRADHQIIPGEERDYVFLSA